MIVSTKPGSLSKSYLYPYPCTIPCMIRIKLSQIENQDPYQYSFYLDPYQCYIRIRIPIKVLSGSDSISISGNCRSGSSSIFFFYPDPYQSDPDKNGSTSLLVGIKKPIACVRLSISPTIYQSQTNHKPEYLGKRKGKQVRKKCIFTFKNTCEFFIGVYIFISLVYLYYLFTMQIFFLCILMVKNIC